MQITELEANLIDRIVHDQYQPTNGGEPEGFNEISSIWAIYCLESKADGGVFASLVKKGLAGHSGFVLGKLNGKRHNEATIRLTQAGWDVYVKQVKK